MARDVTSWFVGQTLLKNSEPKRTLTIGTSDYSGYVTRWPRFRRTWNGIRPVTLTMNFANEDGAFNFFHNDPTTMELAATIQMGYTHPTSGDELITLFAGKTGKVRYANGRADITLTDKFTQLSDRLMGSSDAPVSYVGSNYLPSDVAWWAITSYGGYSSVLSTSNPDIDYEAFQDWAAVFSGDGVYIEAEWTGQKVTEALRKIGRYTYSAIYMKEDKISFHRFGIADANVSSLSDENIQSLDLSYDSTRIINKQHVGADYRVGSDYWGITVNDEDTSSVNSFGLREATEQDKNVWYVDSTSALNLAQRITLVEAQPYGHLKIGTTLVGLPRLIGETLSVQDNFHSINQSYRIMEQDIDMDKGLITFSADRSQFFSSFILDTSSLDGVDVLT